MTGWMVALLVSVSMFVGACLWELVKFVITDKRGRVAQDIADFFNYERDKG